VPVARYYVYEGDAPCVTGSIGGAGAIGINCKEVPIFFYPLNAGPMTNASGCPENGYEGIFACGHIILVRSRDQRHPVYQNRHVAETPTFYLESVRRHGPLREA